uniref:Uncharacterized protein n=1 Tax=Pipistrellus kuhlii TaxID=59472 RepID=A0A7J7S6J8_PIPKU|nr:hypothetical protein mPipKuh1_010025 [Pipistrellus kuhlii]
MEAVWKPLMLPINMSAHHSLQPSAQPQTCSSMDGWMICQVQSFNSNDKYRVCPHNSFSSAHSLFKAALCSWEGKYTAVSLPLGGARECKHRSPQSRGAQALRPRVSTDRSGPQPDSPRAWAALSSAVGLGDTQRHAEWSPQEQRRGRPPGLRGAPERGLR